MMFLSWGVAVPVNDSRMLTDFGVDKLRLKLKAAYPYGPSPARNRRSCWP